MGLGKRHWSSAHPRYCDANRTTHSSSGTKSISTSSLEDITYKLTHTHNPSTMHTHTLLRLDLCPCCSWRTALRDLLLSASRENLVFPSERKVCHRTGIRQAWIITPIMNIKWNEMRNKNWLVWFVQISPQFIFNASPATQTINLICIQSKCNNSL